MVLKTIVPFEPVTTDRIPEGDNWISQIKWDGVRVLTYYDGHSIKLYNRKINERTYHYPELTNIKSYCKANSVILDGEIISLGSHGQPSFSKVMRRDGIKRLERVRELQTQVPITYMIFDVVYYNGYWINDLSLAKRIDILSKIIIPQENIQLVSIHQDADALFNVIKQYKMEGIIIKDLNSKYYINGKNDRWQKKKFYQDLVAVVGGVTFRNGIVNSILLGLYDDKGLLWYIGHVGTGKLKHTDWISLTEKVKQIQIDSRPFTNKPERLKDAIWVQPQITTKVQYIEWTDGKVLRQPSIQAFVETAPDECTFNSF